MINDNNRDNDDSDNESNESNNNITIHEGLSESTLSLLLQFLPNKRFDNDYDDDNDNNKDNDIKDNMVCVAYRDNDINVITETINRLKLKNLEKEANLEVKKNTRILLPLLNTIGNEDIYKTLINDGVVRINSILSSEYCDLLLEFINAKLLYELETANNPQCQSTGFGNVLCRENRYDLYLQPIECHDALKSILYNDSILSNLFKSLFSQDDAEFHELSVLVSDAGAKSQSIHPDTKYTEECPLYTCFIALQNVTEDMGATIFLPKTNTEKCHILHKDIKTKDDFLTNCEYRQSLLNKGDVAIMDSRLLHCGDSNYSSRRVLLYFTLRNPQVFETYNIPSGSKWENLNINLSDFKS